jgi:protein arginine kinase
MRDLDKNALVESHMISPLLAQKEVNTGLIVSEDESVSIMINEEDHLHIQAVYAGMNMSKALEEAMKVDDYFSDQFGYAFDDRYGYLTSCPTNVGTGLRASYIMFLPALSMGGKMEKLSEEISKYGAQIRSIYGEGSKNFGHMYIISNKTSLGRSETEIIDNLDQIVTQAMNQERKRREYILTVNSEEIEDKVFRSYGVLKYAKKVSTSDAMLMLSQLKFGSDANVIQFSEECNLTKLMMEITPANFQKIMGKTINRTERDRFRAEYLNQKLPNLK